MPDTLTIAQVQAELDKVREMILVITGNKYAGEDIGSKNVAYQSTNRLTALYDRERELERKLARLERGGGIRVRSGVPMR